MPIDPTLERCSQPVRVVKEGAVAWKLFLDGASRFNPGNAGAGIYLMKNNVPVYQEGFYLGLKTNNEAEYLALLLGLYYARAVVQPDDILYILSDSELLIRQMKGEYAVKKLSLKQLYACAINLLSGINCSFCHIRREFNKQADRLANQGIDAGSIMPQDFLHLVRDCGFSI